MSEEKKLAIDAFFMIKMVDFYRAAGFSLHEIVIRINDPIGISFEVFKKLEIQEKLKLGDLLNELSLAKIKKEHKITEDATHKIRHLSEKQKLSVTEFITYLIDNGKYDVNYLKEQVPFAFKRYERLLLLASLVNDYYENPVVKIDPLSFRSLTYQSMGLQIDLHIDGITYPEVAGGGGDFAGRYGDDAEDYYFSGGAVGLDRTILLQKKYHREIQNIDTPEFDVILKRLSNRL